MIEYLDSRNSLHYRTKPQEAARLSWYCDDGFGGEPVLTKKERLPADVWDWEDPAAVISSSTFIVTDRGVNRLVTISETSEDVFIDGTSARTVAGVKMLHKLLLTSLHILDLTGSNDRTLKMVDSE